MAVETPTVVPMSANAIARSWPENVRWIMPIVCGLSSPDPIP